MGFAVWQAIGESTKDALQDGDLYDFFHVDALSYVDHYLTERRFAHYLGVASRRLKLGLDTRIVRTWADLIARLNA